MERQVMQQPQRPKVRLVLPILTAAHEGALWDRKYIIFYMRKLLMPFSLLRMDLGTLGNLGFLFFEVCFGHLELGSTCSILFD